MKSLDLYIKYQLFCVENNYAKISFERFCEMKLFFEQLNNPQK